MLWTEAEIPSFEMSFPIACIDLQRFLLPIDENCFGKSLLCLPLLDILIDINNIIFLNEWEEC